MKLFDRLTTKQKQKVKIFSLIALALVFLAVGSTLLEKGKKPSEQKKAVASRKFSILSEKVEKDLWVAAEGQNIKALEKSNEELRSEVEKLRKELEDVKKKQQQDKAPKEKITVPPVPLPEPPSQAQETRATQSKKLLPEAEVKSQKDKQPAPAIRVFESKEPEKPAPQKRAKAESRVEEEKVWIPTGSVTKAVILAGMDVPTSMAAKSEPYPTLLMLTDYSLLPNRHRMDMRECFVVGAGYGSIVEERAYIRTETLSCLRKDGTPWEVALKGQVIGEDGKLGLRGRVVSKQGRQIALSIVTGVLSGLGEALTPKSALHFVEAAKEGGKLTFLTPNLGDVLTSSGLTGVGKALDKVADYYLKLAEQMFPVIEVNAGREVEIIVVKGGDLRPLSSEKGEAPESKEKTRDKGGQNENRHS